MLAVKVELGRKCVARGPWAIIWCPRYNSQVEKEVVDIQRLESPAGKNWKSILLLLNIHKEGLPWWRSGWESACQCRGHGFEPWAGKIPHAAERLGPWATTTEPARLEPVLRNKRRRDSERPAHRDEEWPPLAETRESPRTEMKTQHSHK